MYRDLCRKEKTTISLQKIGSVGDTGEGRGEEGRRIEENVELNKSN